MSEIPKTYEPAAIEERWYAQWLADGCFHADPASAKPACSIVIPPPNVTGVLTLGHVLNNTIQDILARRARMQGREVLWLPGTDHAGIATQTVVERTLKKQGVIRHRDDLGREKFLEKVWEWKDKHGGIIIQQLKKLGCSCDWERERFTMDAEYSKCVSRVFVDLYKKGLIYRGKRMVNWCPASLTALSDEEVVMKPQNGTMYHFKVEVAEQPGTFLTIATTRPETIPGDTYVAVNTKDERYAHLIGKHVRRPLPREIPDAGKLIPIIGDDHVDFTFGTGVLKVTPAHDKADYEIHLRQKKILREEINRLTKEWNRPGEPLRLPTHLEKTEPPPEVIDETGKMTKEAGADLAGLDRFDARNVAVDRLRELGVLVKEEPYQNNVGYSERADVPIEPRLSEQWFLKYPSVELARTCVADGAMKFFPERWAKVYDHWLGGIQDWCISRQLWWGHRIPIWGLEESFTGYAENPSDLDSFSWFSWCNGLIAEPLLSGNVRIRCLDSGEVVTDFASPKPDPLTYRIEVASIDTPLQERLEKSGFTQDSDVLDTWFSSWLWPFATMGWPEETDTLAKFYPTTDLVTGPDIIFFWVARMIMAGFEWMGEMPFKNVYFTGIIRDKQGRKMSKSLGNSPDPLDLIATYGADALRFGVMRSAPLGADILFDDKNVELGRNFCTKLWNAARFRQMQGGETEGEINPVLLTSDDKWILLRLNAAIREVSTALDEYRFSDAAATLYRFFWSEYCDWYVEASKASLYTNATATAEAAAEPVIGDFEQRKTNTLAVMDFILAHTLRLMHPFLPFITEELWHGLGFHDDLPADQGGRTIMFAHWPAQLDNDFYHYYDLDPSAEEAANEKYGTAMVGRALRASSRIPSNKSTRFVLVRNEALSPHDFAVLKLLLNADPFEVVTEYTPPQGTPSYVTFLGTLFLPLEGLIDVAAERDRLAKEIAKVEDELTKVRAKLANPNFAGKVPPAVLADHHQREAVWAEKLTQLQRMREALG